MYMYNVRDDAFTRGPELIPNSHGGNLSQNACKTKNFVSIIIIHEVNNMMFSTFLKKQNLLTWPG